MPQQRINADMIEVVVIAADGTTTTEAFTPREVWTVQAVDTILRTNDAFCTAYPAATLERVESLRGIDEHRHGRYALRYRWARGVAEMWGYVSRKTPAFDFQKGTVGVVATADTPTT